MGRMISPPVGLGLVAYEPLSGPQAAGASGSESVNGFVQTVASAYGAWRFAFTFPPLKGAMFRRYRGWISALHGGANATRWTFLDPDRLSREDAGASDGLYRLADGVKWSSGQRWAHNEPWRVSWPVVALSASADLGATTITLASTGFGHLLAGGDYLGFGPGYFGLHIVTEVLAAGSYRIWPPLRQALTTAHWATLEPTLALRLESPSAASAGRGNSFAENLSATFIEVPDDIVRESFTD